MVCAWSSTWRATAPQSAWRPPPRSRLTPHTPCPLPTCLQGRWESPEIDNPAYKPHPDLYRFEDLKFVGFELWQVRSGGGWGPFVVVCVWRLS